jgi:hypothetical protein
MGEMAGNNADNSRTGSYLLAMVISVPQILLSILRLFFLVRIYNLAPLIDYNSDFWHYLSEIQHTKGFCHNRADCAGNQRITFNCAEIDA